MVEINSDLCLVNAVGGGDLNHKLKLEQLVSSLDADIVEYEPETSPMLRVQFDQSDPTVILFTTGSYFIAGASSVDDLYRTVSRLIKELKRYVSLTEEEVTFEVRNLVFHWSVENEFDLSALSVGLGLENTEYNPEIFPGLVYRIPGTNATFVIYRTGSIMLMGVSDNEGANEYYTELIEELKELGIDLDYSTS